MLKLPHLKKKPKKRKKAIEDLDKAERVAQKVAAIEAKRQEIIQIVHESLERRRQEKLAIQNAQLEKEAKLRQKAIRDAEKSRPEKEMIKIRADMATMIETGVKCVYTSTIIPEKIKFDGRQTLTIKGVKYRLRNNLHMVGWGKEAVTMSSALERVVGNQLQRGFMVVPRKSLFLMWSFPEAFPRLNSRITYTEAGSADGQPDDKSVEATKRIMEYVKKLKKKDLLIVMLSHGIDDLLCCPNEAITLKDKLRLVNRLQGANATPEEIDTVRNKLSAIRGGDLARLAFPAKVVVLVTSDVSSEPLNTLSGGPCFYDPKDATALGIVAKHKLLDKVSQSVRELLEELIPWEMAADQEIDEDNQYTFVNSYVVACNADAQECIAVEAFRYGLKPLKLNTTCSGMVEDFAKEFVEIASLLILGVEGKMASWELFEETKERLICPLTETTVGEIFPVKDNWGVGLCMILGGRPTMNLCPDPGVGGPNQELALYFAKQWYERVQQYPILRGYTVWFLGGSSYGRDGNTDVTGAFGYQGLWTNIYPHIEKARAKYNAAHLVWWKMHQEQRTDAEAKRAEKEMKEQRNNKKMHEDIQPEHVLSINNSNLLFRNINDGDDIFEVYSGNYFTFTNVGDLYVIRIVRFQCNCIGTCHELIDEPCGDTECPVNRTISSELHSREQYCCQFGSAKESY